MARAMKWGQVVDVDRPAHVKPLTLRRRLGRRWSRIGESTTSCWTTSSKFWLGSSRRSGRLVRYTLVTVLPWVAYENYRDEHARLLERRDRLLVAVRRLDLAEGQDVRRWVMAIDNHMAEAARGRRINLLMRYTLFVLGSALPVVALAGWTPGVVIIGAVIAIIVALQNYRWNGQWRWHLLRARQYEVELWHFLKLKGNQYKGMTHAQAYLIFARRMQLMDERFGTLVYEVENWLLPPD